MGKLLFGAFAVILVAASPVRAQGDRPVHFNIGGGFTTPMSDIGERFGTGGGFNAGLVIDVSEAFSIQAEYEWNGLAGNTTEIPTSIDPDFSVPNTTALIESKHDMHSVTFNGLVQAPGDRKFNVYGIGGAGMYHRNIALTTPDVGFTTYCDPYWYFCYPVAVEVDRVVGDRASWDAGMNVGAGVTLKLGDAALFYVETRWHYIWGPEFTGPDGVVRKANGQYFPVTFGFRF
jgi:opacity protein-like surface antigen